MKLYNTLSRQIEKFEPEHSPRVSFYACGFTVYDYTHLGHLRKYTMDDVLIKTLRHLDYQVEFVQNITDVGHLASDADTGEDKLEKGAKKYGESVWDIAHKFEDYFFYSMDKMGNVRPDVSCRATDHIQEQLDMVLELEKKGFTYVIEGDGIYFDTSKVNDYGKLARLDVEKLKEGARLDKVEGKRNKTDFALWKFEREGENRAMVWPSPWAERSFPGWHIECSAMAVKYLGQPIDIHTGGIDHIPVHHTNEIAQVEAASGEKPFVKYWVHHNFLRVNNEKMSKSLGNFFTIDDVIEKGFDPMALRLLFLTAHYRSELNFTWEALNASSKAFSKLKSYVNKLMQNNPSSFILHPSSNYESYKRRFFSFIHDDLKTPEAVAVMWEVLGDKSLSDGEKLGLVLEFDKVLGLGLGKPKGKKPETKISSDVQKLLDERQKAREAKDWQRSDQLRDEIAKLGFNIEDTSDGYNLSKISAG